VKSVLLRLNRRLIQWSRLRRPAGEALPVGPYMSMSLDGYIAGPDDRPGQEFGPDGGRLFNWLDDRESNGPSGQVYREALATGAVISGRRTFELAGRWQGDHPDGITAADFA
jgi:dihydrofolate reductase